MNYFDIILLAVVVFFVIRSTLRGATREIISLLALILAYILSCRYYQAVAQLLQTSLSIKWANTITAFIILFLAVFFAIKVLGWLLVKLLRFIHLTFLDRVVGLFIGVAKGYLIVCFLVIIFLILLPQDSRLLRDSTISQYSLPLIEKISKIIPSPFKEIIDQRTKELKKTDQQKVHI